MANKVLEGSFLEGVAKKVVSFFAKNELIEEAVSIEDEILSREIWDESFQEDPLKSQTAEEEIVRVINLKRDNSQDERRYFLPQMAMNRAFFVGNQWALWSDESQSIEQPVEERTRIVINRARSISRNLIAKLTRNKPTLQAIPPESGDSIDKDAAKVSEKALEAQLVKMKYREHLQLSLQWNHIEGKSYLGLYYDSGIGQKKKHTVPYTKYVQIMKPVLDEMGQPVLNEEGNPREEPAQEMSFSGEWPANRKGEPIRGEDDNILKPENLTEEDLEDQYISMEGDLFLDVIPLHEVFWEPGALSLDKSKWVIHARRQSIEDIRNNHMFENTEDVTPGPGDEDAYNYESSIGIGIFQNSSTGDGGRIANKARTATVYTYYERRSVRYPNGLMICTDGKVLLYKGELPCGEIPLIEMKEMDEPNRFVPVALLELLMSAQYAYNLSRSQELEYVKQAIIGGWIYHENSVDEAPTGHAGEHLVYHGSREPKQMNSPSLPSAIFGIAQADLADMGELSGLNEASRGIATPNVTSGLHAKLLIEADDSKLGPYTDLIEMATQDLGNLVLMYMRKYFDDQRMMQIVGDNRDVEILAFRGADLKADVRVVQGSALSQSKVLKRDEVFTKWQMGWYGEMGTDEAKRLAQKDMDDGYSGPLSATIENNIIQAKRENQAAADGEPIPEPMPWQDFVTHDTEHTEWITGKGGIDAGEEGRTAMWDHMMAERTMLNEMMNPQATEVENEAAQGQGGGGMPPEGGGQPQGGGEEVPQENPDMSTPQQNPRSLYNSFN